MGAVPVPYAEAHNGFMAGIVTPADVCVYSGAAVLGLRMGVMLFLRWLWRSGVDVYAEGYENDPERCSDGEFRAMQAYASTRGAGWREGFYSAKAFRAVEDRTGLVLIDGRRVSGGVPRRKGKGRRKITSRDMRRDLREASEKGYQLNWKSKYRRK